MQGISERILLTLWVGGMWIVGFVVTPTLFQVIDDRSLAGTVAGQIFSLMAYLGLACGILLLLPVLIRSGIKSLRNWRAWTLLSMLILIAIGAFGLTPGMSEIRDAGMLPADKPRFDILHRLASILFMINSMAGLVLVIFGSKGPDSAKNWLRPKIPSGLSSIKFQGGLPSSAWLFRVPMAETGLDRQFVVVAKTVKYRDMPNALYDLALCLFGNPINNLITIGFVFRVDPNLEKLVNLQGIVDLKHNRIG